MQVVSIHQDDRVSLESYDLGTSLVMCKGPDLPDSDSLSMIARHVREVSILDARFGSSDDPEAVTQFICDAVEAYFENRKLKRAIEIMREAKPDGQVMVEHMLSKAEYEIQQEWMDQL